MPDLWLCSDQDLVRFIPDLAASCRDAFFPSSSEPLEQILAKELDRPDVAVFVVGSTIAAAAAAADNDDDAPTTNMTTTAKSWLAVHLASRPYVYELLYLVVAPHDRGRGLGTAMLSWYMNVLVPRMSRDDGIGQPHGLQANVLNVSRTRAWYEARGWRYTTSIQPAALVPGQQKTLARPKTVPMIYYFPPVFEPLLEAFKKNIGGAAT